MSGGRRLLNNFIMGPLHLAARLESTYHIITVDGRVTFINDPQIMFMNFALCACTFVMSTCNQIRTVAVV